MFTKNISCAVKAVAVTLLLLVGTTSYAQSRSDHDYLPYPHMFVSAQGGVQIALQDYWKNMRTPIGQVSFGGWFSPVVGARLGVQGWQTKGVLKSVGTRYRYNYVNPNIDLMINLSNLMWGRDYSRLNLVLLGGVGVDYAWHNNDIQGLRALHNAGELPYTEDLSYRWDDDLLTHNFRVGVMLDYDLGRYLSLNIEAGANCKGDRWNNVYNNHSDWQAYALVGFSVKFGHKKRAAIEEVDMSEPVGNYNESNDVDQTATTTKTVVEKPKTVVEEVAPVRMEQNIFFDINSKEILASEMPKITALSEFMKANPKTTVKLVGYADKETGNAQYNSSLSHQRMRNVYDVLINNGVSKDRIQGDYKGDKEQPFAENDKNRVVICIAAE